MLESVTANEYAEIREVNGETREEIVEPLTNFFVARAQKDFNDRNTFVGGIFTATNRNLRSNFNELHKAAYTGGIDFRHNWKNRNYFIEGNVIASRVLGSKEAITATQKTLRHNFNRADAGHVSVDVNRTSLTGTGGRIEGGKAGGGNWRYNLGFIWRSPELELNDVGFLRQTDEMIQFANLRYLWQVPKGIYRNIQLRYSQFTTYDFDGNYNRIQHEIQANVNWKNNWWTELEMGHKPRIFSNSFLQGGSRWRFSDENYLALFFGTDRSKKISFTLGHVNSAAKQDNFAFQRYVLRMNYQPFDALSLALSTEFDNNPNKTQYVNQTDFGNVRRYILGEIDNKTWSTTLRMNYSLNPNFSIQFYGQPFVSRGRYSNFNYANNPASEDLNNRVTWYDDNQISLNNDVYNIDENLDGNIDYSFNKPDFSFVQLRTNLVARWEYIPGSELFFVWARGGVTFDDPNTSLGRSISNQITNNKVEDTFLIKATYRFVR